MKIVNRADFLKLPPGVLYSRYNPCVITGLEIKKETIFFESPGDWIYIDLIGNVKANDSEDVLDILEDAEEENGPGFNLDFETTERDGSYEVDEMFAIYEPEDIIGLIQTLQSTAQVIFGQAD